jgi:hypothetical protein
VVCIAENLLPKTRAAIVSVNHRMKRAHTALTCTSFLHNNLKRAGRRAHTQHSLRSRRARAAKFSSSLYALAIIVGGALMNTNGLILLHPGKQLHFRRRCATLRRATGQMRGKGWLVGLSTRHFGCGMKF